jgi:hypothetical protein
VTAHAQRAVEHPQTGAWPQLFDHGVEQNGNMQIGSRMIMGVSHRNYAEAATAWVVAGARVMRRKNAR